jgi:hypothetical protein
MNLKIAFLVFFIASMWLHPEILGQNRAPGKNASKKTRHQNLENLARSLAIESKDEENQLRKIYSWVIDHIQYDHQAYRNGNDRINHTCLDILYRRKALCIGYAQLIDSLCILSGIRSEIISGYSKGLLTSTDVYDAPDHVWNAVFINGKWSLLDATWGSGVKNLSDDFTSIYNEDYYLTPPGLFVLNHLPAEPMWQLLSCPVSMELFISGAEQISAHINRTEPCFSFNDSIRAYLSLTPENQRLRKAENQFNFHPSKENRKELNNNYIDYAMFAKDQGDASLESDSIKSSIEFYQTSLNFFSMASEGGAELFNWQKEGLAYVHMNLGRLLYNSLIPEGNPGNDQLKKIELHYQSACTLLEEVQSNIINHQAIVQCNKNLEMIRDMIDEGR